MEQEVAEEITVWEKQYGRRFLVDGVPFIDFVKRQWQEHHEQKEREKEQRVSGNRDRSTTSRRKGRRNRG